MVAEVPGPMLDKKGHSLQHRIASLLTPIAHFKLSFPGTPGQDKVRRHCQIKSLALFLFFLFFLTVSTLYVRQVPDVLSVGSICKGTLDIGLMHHQILLPSPPSRGLMGSLSVDPTGTYCLRAAPGLTSPQ